VRAVVPVHYAGVGCDIAGLQAAIGDEERVSVVEDNAHGLFGSYRGMPLGSFGRFSTLSLHETKNFVCGEGGALVVNRNSDVGRAHVLHDKGTNRQAFMLGLVDKYSWVDTGSSFGLSDLLAGYLLGQLERREEILAKRRTVHDMYQRLLEPEAERLAMRLPFVPKDRKSAYHMYYVILRDAASRDRVLAAMTQNGVQATFHYVPLHSSAGGQRFAARATDCPVSDDVASRLLRLPFHNALGTSQIERVVETLVEALGT
jgi:dTDP-4-amino-4,6-dideoxygalactose transaminase